MDCAQAVVQRRASMEAYAPSATNRLSTISALEARR
jgi:hypothetical protein